MIGLIKDLLLQRDIDVNKRFKGNKIVQRDLNELGTCKSSSMTSSMVIIPTASSFSGSVGSVFPSISKISEYIFFDHFLLLEPPLLELFEFGKLFHFWSDLLLFNILLFSCGVFSPSMSTFTSLTELVSHALQRKGALIMM